MQRGSRRGGGPPPRSRPAAAEASAAAPPRARAPPLRSTLAQAGGSRSRARPDVSHEAEAPKTQQPRQSGAVAGSFRLGREGFEPSTLGLRAGPEHVSAKESALHHE